MSLPTLEVTSLDQLRTWLEAHHTTSDGVWLVTWKKHGGDKHIPWVAFVPELLCFGWIDSQARGVDADRTSRRITPRRKGSHWSAINKNHVARLEAEGSMRPAGLAAIEVAKADGSWSFLDDIEALIEPPDLKEALRGNRGPWETRPASFKKLALFQLKSAKRPATRAKRLTKLLADLAG
ncbi:MAG: YdeI/OmpD-associated family protein [Proteobacteria bacterium]|nr:YdeI/OmpD-associated family protein [Pseudomonadota bacterium]